MSPWPESQLDVRARLDTQMTERAYAQLASSVSAKGKTPPITVDDIEQVDGALRACLRYEGIEPGEVPENIKNLEDRIDWICRPTGTMHRHIRLEGDWYKSAFGPILARLNTGEVIALLPRPTQGYLYLEPGTGRKIRVNARVAQSIDTEAVFFYKPFPARPLTRTDLAAFVARVFRSGDYMAVIIAVAAVTLIGLLPAWANKIAYDVVASSHQPDLIPPITTLLLGVAVSTSLIGICRNLIMDRMSIKIEVHTEAATFSRLLSLPTSFFKEYASGNLASRVASVTNLVQQIVSAMLGAGLTALFSLVYVLQIARFAPALALPALIVAVVEATLTTVVLFVTMRYERDSMEASSKLSGTVTALLNGVQKIKLAGAENRAFARWAAGYSTYARTTYNRPAFVRALPALVALVGLLGNIAIYYLAGSTHVTYPDYMAFTVAFGQMTAAAMALANVAGQLAQIGPTLRMVAPIFQAQPEIADNKPSVTSLTGSIEVSDVSFRYGENYPYVVKDLSFTVRSGEYVALVGRSGSGKSTIVRLLLGFEKPERGTIFYDVHDIQKVDLRSLRQHVGTVMQDGKLFMGDLANNITIAAPGATIDDAWEAAELAGIADDIRQMPMGMHTLVSEGSGGISGGQRQRIMIARAVCGKKSILVFDEATSALDNKTQRHVSDSLDSLHCTRIVVAHRLSTVRHCDRILVVDDGAIAEEGTYDELIAKGGLFSELVARQRIDE